MTLAEQVVAAAKAKGVVLSTAESCTGGLISGAITDVPGSSAVLDRGFVTYSNSAKIEMLGVRRETIDRFGAVSTEVAAEMAAGAVERSDAQIAISVTGIAGPGGSDHKPEGRVCFGVCFGAKTITEMKEFGPIGRTQVRSHTVDHALKMVLSILPTI